MNNKDLKEKLQAEFAEQILNLSEDFGDLCMRVAAENFKDVVLKLTDFNMLISVTAVDFLDDNFLSPEQTERYDVVYHLLSLDKLWRLRIKVAVNEDNPEIESLCDLYQSANFMEREVWDMYGIKFTGHPDLRRILMYEEFKGHPLRKDYPLQGKQPRVKLRSPEVTNTARNMRRPELVQIGKGDLL